MHHIALEAAQQLTTRGRPAFSGAQDLLLAPESQSSRVLARPNYLAELTPELTRLLDQEPSEAPLHRWNKQLFNHMR